MPKTGQKWNAGRTAARSLFVRQLYRWHERREQVIHELRDLPVREPVHDELVVLHPVLAVVDVEEPIRQRVLFTDPPQQFVQSGLAMVP